MRTKEKAIRYFEQRLGNLTYPSKNDCTSENRRKEAIAEALANLEFVREVKDFGKDNFFDKYQELANIKKTQSCGGHYKGQMNDQLFAEKKAEFGGDIPSNALLYSFGIFNGEGSY
jgi:hypothetical protein